jgi:hypothetical protein
MSTGLPLYGRKWKIQVLKSSGEEAWTVSDSTFDDPYQTDRAPLRCIFRISKQYGQTPWTGELEIWNLQGDTLNEIIKEGYAVKVEAGYQDGKYGKIFEAEVFQPMVERRNVTDFVTTLVCLDGQGIIHSNFVSFTQEAGYDYRGLITAMAKRCRTPMPLGTISENLKTTKSPRGAVIFGDPRDHLRDIARDNNAQWFAGDNKLHMGSLEDPSYESQALVLTPESGLIGDPQWMQDGIHFRCLLDPTLTIKLPLQVVKLDNVLIRQLKIAYGSNPPLTMLDEDGFYKIVGVTYIGDTRGNEWYTECIGVNLLGTGTALLKPGYKTEAS